MKKLLILALSLVYAQAPFAETLVTVNGTKIDSKDLEHRAKIVQQQSQTPDSPELRQYLIDEMIAELIVSQEAKRLQLDKGEDYQNAVAKTLKESQAKGLDKQADFKKRWADHQNQLLMIAYANHVIKNNPVTEEQIQARYQDIKTRYEDNEEIRLGEIVLDKAEQAEKALQALKNKEPFKAVVQKYSIDPEARQTGGLIEEYIALKDLKEESPKVYEMVQNLKKDQFTTTPLQENNISVIFYVQDKRKIAIEPFEKLQEGIAMSLRDERVRHAIDELGKTAKIVPANNP